jgi:hypothetical protein
MFFAGTDTDEHRKRRYCHFPEAKTERGFVRECPLVGLVRQIPEVDRTIEQKEMGWQY